MFLGLRQQIALPSANKTYPATVTFFFPNFFAKGHHNRQELKAKGATQVIIKDFINNNGYTEVSFAALNAQNKQVGTFSMKGRSCYGLYKGQKIAI